MPSVGLVLQDSLIIFLHEFFFIYFLYFFQFRIFDYLKQNHSSVLSAGNIRGYVVQGADFCVHRGAGGHIKPQQYMILRLSTCQSDPALLYILFYLTKLCCDTVV